MSEHLIRWKHPHIKSCMKRKIKVRKGHLFSVAFEFMKIGPAPTSDIGVTVTGNA